MAISFAAVYNATYDCNTGRPGGRRGRGMTSSPEDMVALGVHHGLSFRISIPTHYTPGPRRRRLLAPSLRGRGLTRGLPPRFQQCYRDY